MSASRRVSGGSGDSSLWKNRCETLSNAQTAHLQNRPGVRFRARLRPHGAHRRAVRGARHRQRHARAAFRFLILREKKEKKKNEKPKRFLSNCDARPCSFSARRRGASEGAVRARERALADDHPQRSRREHGPPHTATRVGVCLFSLAYRAHLLLLRGGALSACCPSKRTAGSTKQRNTLFFTRRRDSRPRPSSSSLSSSRATRSLTAPTPSWSLPPAAASAPEARAL